MKYNFEHVNKISKTDFLNIKEEDIVFITNPGRMGDEDGSTFIVQNSNCYTVYRIDGWYMGDRTQPDFISFNDMIEHFPNWDKQIGNEDDINSYKYIYMGFGNGLCVRSDICDEYQIYLDKEIENFAEEHNLNDDEKKHQQYGIIFNVWDRAVIEMTKNKNIIIK